MTGSDGRRSRRPQAYRPGPVEQVEGRCLPSAGARIHRSGLGEARPAPGAAGVAVERDIDYSVAGDPRRALDVYLPRGPAPAGGWPTVVAIHGGGWRRFNKEEYGPTVSPLARHGFAVVVPDYTLSAPGAPSWPANLEDLRAVLRWVPANAARLGLDPGRVAALGESAGGHLAALLATRPDDPADLAGPAPARVGAVVDFYGPTDLAAFYRGSAFARQAVTQFLGTTPDLDPARYAAASPVANLSPGDPPMLLIQGARDPLVAPSQSRELAAGLTALGIPNRLIVVPGAGHGFGLHVGRRDLTPPIVAFLDRALGAARPS